MKIRVNGETRDVLGGLTVLALLREVGLGGMESGIAVAINDQVITRTEWSSQTLGEADHVEIVQAVQGGSGPDTETSLIPSLGEDTQDLLEIAGESFRSRLILGTSRYPNLEFLRQSMIASGAEMATVSIRRVDSTTTASESVYSILKKEGVRLLPNTAGCYTAREAILMAEMARESLQTNWIKLELLGDDRTLYPDVLHLVGTAEKLVRQGFTVLPYCTDDPVICKRLEDVGCAAVMPLAAPIGSGRGIKNPHALLMIKEAVGVPVIIDAGIGTASDATIALELGLDAVLLNSAVAGAEDPVQMAGAMKLAVESGRLAHLAGRIPHKQYATASSPLSGMPETRFGKQGPSSLLRGAGKRPGDRPEKHSPKTRS